MAKIAGGLTDRSVGQRCWKIYVSMLTPKSAMLRRLMIEVENSRTQNMELMN